MDLFRASLNKISPHTTTAKLIDSIDKISHYFKYTTLFYIHILIMKALPTRKIGKTDLDIFIYGLGCAPLGNLYHPVNDIDAKDTVRSALNYGLRYLDTAPYYGFGLSERRVGDVLSYEERSSFILSTKVGRLLVPCELPAKDMERYGYYSHMPFEPVYDYSYDGIMRSYEDSLQRLGVNRIDILFIHDIGKFTHGNEEHLRHYKIAMESGYKALNELRSSGQIKAFGLGVNEYEICEDAMNYGDFDCFLLAGRYTLLEQEAIKSFLPKCEKNNISIIIGGAYNSGILAVGTKTDRALNYNYERAPSHIINKVTKIENICDAFQIPLAAAAIQFPLAHSAVSSVILGMDKQEYVIKNLELINLNIPPDFWQSLRAKNLIHPEAPVPE